MQNLIFFLVKQLFLLLFCGNLENDLIYTHCRMCILYCEVLPRELTIAASD